MFTQSVASIYNFEKNEGYPKDSLLNVMLFETGGTLSPSIKNAAGSGAVGIIQFMPSTLNGLGYTTAQVAAMSVEQQLEVVRKYLKPYRAKLLATNDLGDFYFAVLYPALIGKPYDAVFATKGTIRYTQNAGLDANKDGVITKQDILRKFLKTVNAIRKNKGLAQVYVYGNLFVFLALFAGYFFFK